MHSLLALITEVDSSTLDDFHRIAIRIIRKSQSFHGPIVDILAKSVAPEPNGITSFVDVIYKETCFTFSVRITAKWVILQTYYLSVTLTDMSKSLTSLFISIVILERFIVLGTVIVSQLQDRLELILVADVCINNR